MAAPTEAIGEIRSDCVYTLDEAKARTGLGAAALRTARRQGLKVRKIGRRAYVLGRDIMAYIEQAD